MEKDLRQQQNLPYVQHFLAGRFSSLSLEDFQSNHEICAKLGLSWASHQFFNSPNRQAFCGNFVMTRDEWYNKIHEDVMLQVIHMDCLAWLNVGLESFTGVVANQDMDMSRKVMPLSLNIILKSALKIVMEWWRWSVRRMWNTRQLNQPLMVQKVTVLTLDNQKSPDVVHCVKFQSQLSNALI